jgi:signal transduction histidine kinase
VQALLGAAHLPLVAAIARNGLGLELDGVVLRFSNPCRNLSAEHLPRLTEPFWRGAESRSDPDRHGLGLNIAQGMARLGLAFRLEDGRFVAEVEIPGARAS